MLDRFNLLIGTDIEKLKSSTVFVLGLGGVGGYVVEGLVRSGISNFIIADFDKIELSNLNRQIITSVNNIGNLKTDETKKRILSINPNAKVEIIDFFVDECNIDKIFNYNIDFFVDACDSIKTKKCIIDKCLSQNIDFVTCMGTGNRLDPTCLKVVDIRDTSYDPVAKILRKHVKDMNYKNRINCLWSSEIPLRKGEIIGSCAFVPSVAGLIISSFVVKHLINQK